MSTDGYVGLQMIKGNTNTYQMGDQLVGVQNTLKVYLASHRIRLGRGRNSWVSSLQFSTLHCFSVAALIASWIGGWVSAMCDNGVEGPRMLAFP